MKVRNIIIMLSLVLLIAVVAFATASVLNYKEQGGARWVIGGSLDVVSGGDLDIESGGSLKIAGVQVTASAAQLNGGFTIEHVLGNKTITAAETGETYYFAKVGGGAGDPNDIIATLPPAAAGLYYTFVDANETAVADVTITAASGDKINDGSAGASLVHDTDAENYALVTLKAIDATDWVIVTSTGTWANE